MERNTARWEVTVAGWRREEERLALLLLFFSWQQLGECIFENVQDYRMSRDTKNQEAQLTLSVDFCFFFNSLSCPMIAQICFCREQVDSLGTDHVTSVNRVFSS